MDNGSPLHEQIHMGACSLNLENERRELVQIDDCLLLEYRKDGEQDETVPPEERLADEAITTFLAKPSAELLALSEGNEAQSLLLPWLMKIDWTLELVLKGLARLTPGGIRMPRLTNVNISGGGIRFTASRRFEKHDILDLRLILPPFVPIQTKAEVLRAVPKRDGSQAWEVAARFTTLNLEDRERLIRHVLHVQAERLRARHMSAGTDE